MVFLPYVDVLSPCQTRIKRNHLSYGITFLSVCKDVHFLFSVQNKFSKIKVLECMNAEHSQVASSHYSTPHCGISSDTKLSAIYQDSIEKVPPDGFILMVSILFHLHQNVNRLRKHVRVLQQFFGPYCTPSGISPRSILF